eukprot:14765024-Ditylum_brightwellii.AAC.1
MCVDVIGPSLLKGTKKQCLEPSYHAKAFGGDVSQVPLCGEAVVLPFMGTKNAELLLFEREIFSG